MNTPWLKFLTTNSLLREATGETGAAPAGGDTPVAAVGEGSTATPALLSDSPTAAPLVATGSEGGAVDDGGTPEEAKAPVVLADLALPEGVEVNAEATDAFLGLVNNAELSPAEMAKGLVELQLSEAEKAQTAANEAGSALWDEMQVKWVTEAKALPTIGGEALPQTLATIKSGLKQMGANDATFEALKLTGAGNHPEIIRVLHALTKGLAEQPPVTGDIAPGAQLSQAERMFGAS